MRDRIVDFGMKHEIRLAMLFIEQLRTKEKREGYFCKKGRPAPCFFIPTRNPDPPCLSLYSASSSSSSITMLDHQAPKTPNFRSAQLENP